MASRCTRRGELDGSGLFVVFAICFAWDLERSPLGSVSEVLYLLMYSVKMIADDLLELLINDILMCISDVCVR